MVRLIVLDIDGTLLPFSTAEIPAANVRAVAAARDAGIRVTLATARKFSGPQRFARELDLAADTPLICHGGAYVATADGTVLAHTPLEMDIARAMAEFADALGARLILTVDERNYIARSTDGDLEASYVDQVLVAECREALIAPPTRIVAFDPPTCEALYAHFGNDPRATCSRFYEDGVLTCVAAFHPMVSKGRAVRELCAHLAIDPRDAAAMGDQETDVSMFEAVGLSIAMPHADATVRAAATVTAPSDPAVAWAIHEILAGRLDARVYTPATSEVTQ